MIDPKFEREYKHINRDLDSVESIQPIYPGLVDELFNSPVISAYMRQDGFSAEDVKNCRESIKRQIEYDRKMTFSRIQTLSDSQFDHKPWLVQKNNSIKWDHWGAYKEVLGYGPKVKKVNQDVNDILDLIEDPERPGPWDVRGLVVGDVQAGKTSNYIGLMTKAVDAGYKILIVLAGVTNDLRMQTQIRIDAGLLGYDTEKRGQNGIVRRPFPGTTIHAQTNSGYRGDYSKGAFGNNIRMNGQDCCLFVIKKNVSILRNVFHDILNNLESNGKVNAPLLLIDDEADNASINGKQQVFDSVTGEPVNKKEIDPTAINKYIRAILTCFSRSAYIGYTATPYANIFGVPGIEREKKFKEKNCDTEFDLGEDLFPRNFISYIESPPNYYGPERVFGLSGDASGRLPLVVDIEERFPDDLEPAVNDDGDFIYNAAGHYKYDVSKMPESLKYAIRGFIVTAAAKELRITDTKHNTMLIHVDRLTASHDSLKEWVVAYLDDLKKLFRIADKETKTKFYNSLEQYWNDDYLPTHIELLHKVEDEGLTELSWSDVKELIPKYVRAVDCIVVNGKKDSEKLNYDGFPGGRTVIAIGGDKLARGLTLSGLSCSYFLRSSRMYDSLSQMGRWFGYRDGYIDLCRIYATYGILSDFEEIALANSDLKEQFNMLKRQQPKKTPQDFGLRVRTRPGTNLIVTALNKSRNVEKRTISFANSSMSTAYLPFDQKINNDNCRHYMDFLAKLGAPDRLKGNAVCWTNVPAETIIEGFLTKELILYENKISFKVNQIADYILKQSATHNELTTWTVVVRGGDSQEAITLPSGQKLQLPHRSAILCGTSTNKSSRYYEINQRRVPSGDDEALDLTKEEYEKALKQTNIDRMQKGNPKPANIPSPINIRCCRPKEKGLLLLYFFELRMENEKRITFPAFMISFPETEYPQEGVTYWMNPVAVRQADEEQDYE